MRPQRATDAGPIRVPLKRMVQIRRSSASLNAITKGRYKHKTGRANIIVTRKMGIAEARKRTLKSRAKRITERSKEPNHRPMRLNVFIKLL
jgi:hypothetical protein